MPEPANPPDRGWFSSRRKKEGGLRLICGEELDLVSRERGGR